jgi:hypothetical protein
MILNSIMRKFQRPGGPPQESGALRDRQGGPPDWVLPGATIDMWFAKSVYFGASPGNLSVVRASLGYGDDETGRWVQFGNDVARITAKGLLIEDGCSNVVLWCRDLTNAVWSVTGITTAKNQAGFDGTAAGASSLTATAANATILQRITDPASVRRQQSVFAKRLTGSGSIQMTMDGGTNWTSVAVTSTWTRVSIPAQTLANPTVGLRIVTKGDSIAVDCVQNEKLTGDRDGLCAVGSPIVTTAAGADRAADIVALSPVPNVGPTAASMYCAGVLIGQASTPTAYPYLFNAVGADAHEDVLGFGTRNDNSVWPGFGALISRRRGRGAELPEGSPSAGESFAVAGAFSTTRSQTTANGLLGTATGSSPPLNPITAVGFGLPAHFQPPPFFYFRRVALWPSTELADSVLSEITKRPV